MQLTIKGLASGKIIKVIPVSEAEASLNLLLFLSARSIPIASSCSGENVCKKCKINGELISCTYTVGEFISKHGEVVTVSYL
ncbi:hypothetical protein [Bacteriovorax sp. Seq25_V]|uniref:hypothetical protein n=1 Tax=Bacteriovorax sp. Seq25_V TaxID=1201288 RepID=UPI00038A1192|nr:hypothetical protein [Bacteriovorax sp. Seq25_V]EQC44311.1 hypothetical protein M900_A0282 [Bacteriovorax sp. Seq25_V]